MNDFIGWLGLGIAALAGGISAWLMKVYKMGKYLDEPPEAPEIPDPPKDTTPPVKPVLEANGGQKEVLLWDTPKHAFHSTRVICDMLELTVEQKNVVCACIYQESEFNNNAVGKNKNPKTGKVWSTDFGMVQVNDTKGWHIGKGLRFSSVQDVLDNPEKAVVWMISVMRDTGKLQPWASFTSGAYKKWLPKTSEMWALAK